MAESIIPIEVNEPVTTRLDVDIPKLRAKRRFFVHKRLLDILGSGLGMIVLIPVYLIVAIAIKIENPMGPIFFSQMRVGKEGKTFKMYKFRSMMVDAEAYLGDLWEQNEMDGLMFKMKDDPRVTRVGKFIRKFSLDELPQLLNVLIGDMSLIGPRPPLVYEYEEYNDYHKQRLIVQPGCSGRWQVTGRNEVTFEEMVEMDIKYINSISMKQDMVLILKTISMMIFPKNDAW